MSLQRYLNPKHKIVVGCDEVGRGCLSGPVVAAAVVLNKGKIHPDLQDSKKLSRSKISEVASWIRNHARSYSIAKLNAAEIDEHNILQSSFKAMHIAISKLDLTPDLILVDGNRFKPYRDINHHCVIKGDSIYYEIAAASILAKEARDRFMEKLDLLYPIYDWKNNVGYPTRHHKISLEESGPTPFHRLTFKGVLQSKELFDSNT